MTQAHTQSRRHLLIICMNISDTVPMGHKTRYTYNQIMHAYSVCFGTLGHTLCINHFLLYYGCLKDQRRRQLNILCRA